MEHGYSHWAKRAWIAVAIPSVILFIGQVAHHNGRLFIVALELLVFAAITAHWLATLRRDGIRPLRRYIIAPLLVGTLLATMESLVMIQPTPQPDVAVPAVTGGQFAWSVAFGAVVGVYMSIAGLIFRKMARLPALPEDYRDPETHWLVVIAEVAILPLALLYWILVPVTALVALFLLTGETPRLT